MAEYSKHKQHNHIGNLVVCDVCGVFETLPVEEQKVIKEVVLEFPDELVDRFFHDAGMIFENERKRMGNKALSPRLIAETRTDNVDSGCFDILFDEVPKEKIMESLQNILFEIKSNNKS